MEDKLKRCPFCGGEARILTDMQDTTTPVFSVVCDECESITYFGDVLDKEGTVEAWNNRLSPWHTGTPTEEGFWLVKYKCVVEGKYNGRLTYRAVKIEKDKIDGFAYESGGIGAEEYWKPIEYQKIDDLWKGEE